MVDQVDILIVGGGLAGISLMLALEHLPISTLLVEASPLVLRTQADFDARTLALSPSSVRILEGLNLWAALEEYATPIQTIHVSQQGRFGNTVLENHQQPLGYVLEIHRINHALLERAQINNILSPAKVTHVDTTQNCVTIDEDGKQRQLKAKLIVAADGAQSSLRQYVNLSADVKKYNQHGIVATLALNRSHHNYAYERFTPTGPLALLPITDQRASLIWAMTPQQAQEMMQLSDDLFLKSLQQAFGYRLGRFNRIGKRTVFPLAQVIMPQQAAWPIVFIGNAAHTLHPVAAQGFNLGLRDVAMLAQCIHQLGLQPNMLDEYQDKRRHDQQLTSYFTDGLISLFSQKLPGLSHLRALGLIAMDNNAALKKLMIDHAQGFIGTSPDLICGLSLD